MATEPYDMVCTIVGKPGDGVVYLRNSVNRAVTLPAGLTASHGVCVTAPTASAVFTLYKAAAATPNTFVSFGTMTFAIAAVKATFIAASGVVLAIGDVIAVSAPSPQDATLADIGFGIAGTRVFTAGGGTGTGIGEGIAELDRSSLLPNVPLLGNVPAEMAAEMSTIFQYLTRQREVIIAMHDEVTRAINEISGNIT